MSMTDKAAVTQRQADLLNLASDIITTVTSNGSEDWRSVLALTTYNGRAGPYVPLTTAIMDSCPVEVLHNVASYACKDGGRTGCSLSLVSHYIRNATSHARYHSVALADTASIEAFARIANGANTQLGIYSLFVAARGVGDASADDIDFENGYEEGEDRALQRPIIDILRAAAPTITTLFFDVPGSLFRTHKALDIEYPNLVDLSVPSFEKDLYGDKILRPLLSLKRLHITDLQYSSTTSPWEELASRTPSLEYIRVSNVLGASRLPSFLRVLLGLDVPRPGSATVGSQVVRGPRGAYPVGSKDALEAARIAACLSKLKTVFVQPGTYVQHGWCGTGRMAHSGMLYSLHCVASQTAKGGSGGRLHFLDKRGSVEEVKDWDISEFENWLSIENGGDGPWSVESDEVE